MKRFFSETSRNIFLYTFLLIPMPAGKLSWRQPFSLSLPFILKWHYSSEILAATPSACGEDAIYLPLADGTLISLRMTDGQLLWKADIGGDFSAPPKIVGQIVYAITGAKKLDDVSSSNKQSNDQPVILRALSRTSGVTLWTLRLPQSPRSEIVVNDHTLFAALSDDRLYAIDKEAGTIKWLVKLPYRSFTQPEVFGTSLYVSTGDGYLLALNQETGTILWHYRTRGEVSALKAADDGILYVGTADGYVSALRVANGKLVAVWRKRAGTHVETISEAGGGLLVTTQDNFALFFETKNGRRRWKRLMPARLSAQPLTDSDSALFAPLGEDSCIVLSLRDGKQVNAISLGKDNSILAAPTSFGEFVFVPTRDGLMAFAPAK